MPYRVIRITTNDFSAFNTGKPPVITEAVIWTGSSVERMSEEYPPSDVYGADELKSSWFDSDTVHFDYRFEQGNGEDWEEIPDPRIRLDPELTEDEKELILGHWSCEDEAE